MVAYKRLWHCCRTRREKQEKGQRKPTYRIIHVIYLPAIIFDLREIFPAMPVTEERHGPIYL
jgi:hypothetical protein